MSQADARQRGFTLIEMSIVLVIIGLIIGGILKGQELIESARIKNVINQIDIVRTATNAFQDRFNSLPGDYNQPIITSAPVGNQDGIIAVSGVTAAYASTGAIAGAAKNAGELQFFFDQLIAANLLGGGAMIKSGGTAPTNFAGGANPSPFPSSAYPQSGLSIAYGTHSGDTAANPEAKTTNWLIMSKWGTTIIQTSATAIVSPSRAFQLDAKYDDGTPLGGNIRSLGATTNCTGSTYGSTSETVSCDFAFTLN